MITPKVVAHNFQRFLEISSSLISNIVAVGTTVCAKVYVPCMYEQIFINMHVIKKTDTPNTKASKESYEYKNIKERKGNKMKRKS